MLFKEIVDARTHARTDDGRRTLKDHKSSLEHFVKTYHSHAQLFRTYCLYFQDLFYKKNQYFMAIHSV